MIRINSQTRTVIIEKSEEPLMTTSFLSFDGNSVLDGFYGERSPEEMLKMLEVIINVKTKEGQNMLFLYNSFLNKFILNILKKNGFIFELDSDGNGINLIITMFKQKCKSIGCVYNVSASCACSEIGINCKSWTI